MKNPVLRGEKLPRFKGEREARQAADLTRGGPPTIPKAMAHAIHAFLLALGDLPRRPVLRVLLQSLTLTLVLLMLSGVALFHVVRWMVGQGQWLNEAGRDLASGLAIVAILIGGWILFRAIAIVVIGLFADAIVADVEGRHYPATAHGAIAVGWRRNIMLALASLARLVGVNLVALPGYILLLVTGVGTPILVLIVNAWLLGRDLEAMARARHPGLPRLDRSARWSLGLLSAASFLVPVANLLAPLLSAAMAVHMLHLRNGPSKS